MKIPRSTAAWLGAPKAPGRRAKMKTVTTRVMVPCAGEERRRTGGHGAVDCSRTFEPTTTRARFEFIFKADCSKFEAGSRSSKTRLAWLSPRVSLEPPSSCLAGNRHPWLFRRRWLHLKAKPVRSSPAVRDVTALECKNRKEFSGAWLKIPVLRHAAPTPPCCRWTSASSVGA